MGGNNFDESPTCCPTAKIHEAWASSDLGPVMSRSRYNRLKRSYIRACARSIREDIITFQGKRIYPHQIPFRIKKLIQAKRAEPAPSKHAIPSQPVHPPGPWIMPPGSIGMISTPTISSLFRNLDGR